MDKMNNMPPKNDNGVYILHGRINPIINIKTKQADNP